MANKNNDAIIAYEITENDISVPASNLLYIFVIAIG